MAILLGIDFETTGLDPKTDKIIEVGAVLMDTEGWKLLRSESLLIHHRDEGGVHIPPEITKITGIDQSMMKFGSLSTQILSPLLGLGGMADYVVAHNAPFEQSFIQELYGHLFDETINWFFGQTKPWIDTKTDLPYPEGKGRGTLTHIAADHGFLNPFPHRALFDVMTMFKVMEQYDFDEVVKYSQAKTVILTVRFPFDETGEKQKTVKALGFYWNPSEKCWYKQVKDFQADQVCRTAWASGFEVFIHGVEVTYV